MITLWQKSLIMGELMGFCSCIKCNGRTRNNFTNYIKSNDIPRFFCCASSKKSSVVVDMPFVLTKKKKKALDSAIKIMKESCHAVKLEGGSEIIG